MANEEIDMEQDLAPREVGLALDVSTRTVNNWLNDGTLAYHLDFKDRRRIPVSELFKLAEKKGLTGNPAEKKMRERLVRDILPRYSREDQENTRTDVLVSV